MCSFKNTRFTAHAFDDFISKEGGDEASAARVGVFFGSNVTVRSFGWKACCHLQRCGACGTHQNALQLLINFDLSAKMPRGDIKDLSEIRCCSVPYTVPASPHLNHHTHLAQESKHNGKEQSKKINKSKLLIFYYADTHVHVHVRIFSSFALPQAFCLPPVQQLAPESLLRIEPMEKQNGGGSAGLR